MDIKKRLYYILLVIFLVVLAGSSGYYLLFGGKPKYMDCLYMTVISLTSVGYGETLEVTGNVPAQIFTMLLITVGMGIILYGISTLTAIIIEGELTGILRKNKMEKQIKKLSNHYIVCGGGETGRHVVSELMKNKEKVVLIEHLDDNIEKSRHIEGLLYIKGDATDDHNLITAGIDKAAGIVICLPSDKDTLYVTMTARMMNGKMRIISRMVDQALQPKLKKAGADSTVSPNFIGGLRMASEMLRPTVVDFLDSMLRSSQGHIRIGQLNVKKNSKAIGKKISDLELTDKFNLVVLGSRYQDREIHFNPPPSTVITEDLTIIIMGDVENIARAKEVF
ncbi:MAG: potassium channel protein [Pseudomonadota bacterium]|nr:potassium channel protein [Pseudomonadota bacterium]MBU1397496.1 potassium channel protein [Pseudomonadota bacterium]MBU1570446.1 potassium channel protein [Pseudomonadota bacterium]